MIIVVINIIIVFFLIYELRLAMCFTSCSVCFAKFYFDKIFFLDYIKMIATSLKVWDLNPLCIFVCIKDT